MSVRHLSVRAKALPGHSERSEESRSSRQRGLSTGMIAIPRFARNDDPSTGIIAIPRFARNDIRCLLVTVIALGPAAPASAAAQTPVRAETTWVREHDVAVPMRDGVALRADVW